MPPARNTRARNAGASVAKKTKKPDAPTTPKVCLALSWEFAELLAAADGVVGDVDEKLAFWKGSFREPQVYRLARALELVRRKPTCPPQRK
jgi:hypothetical protein